MQMTMSGTSGNYFTGLISGSGSAITDVRSYKPRS